MLKRGLSALLLLFLPACACLTGEAGVVQRDEFQNKIALLNEQVLGELKYEDPSLDLRTLAVQDYLDLFDRMELTSDDKKVLANARTHAPERKFLLERDTFLICFRSISWQLLLCDDAATPGADKAQVQEPLPPLGSFFEAFVGGRDSRASAVAK